MPCSRAPAEFANSDEPPDFKLLHVNRLNTQVLASHAIVDGRWYFRTDRELLAIDR